MNILITQIDIGGWFRWEIFYGLIASLFIIAYSFRQYVEQAFLLAWVYTLTRSLYIFERPEATYYQLSNAFNATSGTVFAEVLVIPLFVLVVNERMRGYLWKTFSVFAVADIFSIWFLHHGLCIPSTSVSFDTALLALYLPFAPALLEVAIILTIAFHHGTTAWMIAMTVFSVSYLYKNIPWRKKILTYSTVLTLSLASVYLAREKLLIGLHERMDVWGKFYDIWKDGWDFNGLVFGGWWFPHWFGVGPGSFVWVSILKSVDHGNVFVQLHNDWLQILFELGILGVLFVACTLVVAICKSIKDPKMLAGILGTAVFMCSYHPLRFFPSALLVALIFRKALVR